MQFLCKTPTCYMFIFYCTLCSIERHSFNTGMVGMVSFQMIPKRSDRVECQTMRIVRGQLRVPLRVMVFSWCSLGILGDELTHTYPQYRACIRLPIGVRWDRGISNYPPEIGDFSSKLAARQSAPRWFGKMTSSRWVRYGVGTSR